MREADSLALTPKLEPLLRSCEPQIVVRGVKPKGGKHAPSRSTTSGRGVPYLNRKAGFWLTGRCFFQRRGIHAKKSDSSSRRLCALRVAYPRWRWVPFRSRCTRVLHSATMRSERRVDGVVCTSCARQLWFCVTRTRSKEHGWHMGEEQFQRIKCIGDQYSND